MQNHHLHNSGIVQLQRVNPNVWLLPTVHNVADQDNKDIK